MNGTYAGGKLYATVKSTQRIKRPPSQYAGIKMVVGIYS